MEDVPENIMAEYLCKLANASEHPRSMLNTTLVALACFSEATDTRQFTSLNLSHFVNGLVKSRTSQPMCRSPVMPVKNFTQTCFNHGWETFY